MSQTGKDAYLMQKKSIFNISIGNIFEWYDYGLFAIYAPLFNKLFFPIHNALFNVFSVFAIGFLCRPLGALLFGYMGDTKGRAKTLRFSIIMVAFPTFLIGCIPTFFMIHSYAIFFLLIVRIWQGICIGGEYGGSLVYLTEKAPQHRRAFFTSFGTISANVGILSAMLIVSLMHLLFSDEFFNQWGWRIPYFLSGIFCFFIYFSRFQLEETIPFERLSTKKLIVGNPISTMFKTNKVTILRLLGMCCIGSTFYSYCIIFLPYLLEKQKHYPHFHIFFLTSFFSLLMIFFIPFFTNISDRIGRRPMLLFNAFYIGMVSLLSLFLLQSTSYSLIIFAFLLFSLGSALEQSTTPVSMIESLPSSVRYTTLSFAYNLGNGIFGGTLPLICQWLLTKSFTISPAIYVTFIAAISGIVVFFFVNETSQQSLIDC
jgi:MHS family proline/betaine transporter-like MFS transporter